VGAIGFRRMFHFPNNNIIKNHDVMGDISLPNEEYVDSMLALQSQFNGSNLNISFHDEQSLKQHAKEIIR
jgi:hypothetical protein